MCQFNPQWKQDFFPDVYYTVDFTLKLYDTLHLKKKNLICKDVELLD